MQMVCFGLKGVKNLIVWNIQLLPVRYQNKLPSSLKCLIYLEATQPLWLVTRNVFIKTIAWLLHIFMTCHHIVKLLTMVHPISICVHSESRAMQMNPCMSEVG